MPNYRWVRFPKGLSYNNYIYNVDEKCIYDYNWNKIKLRYNPDPGEPGGFYQGKIYIFCIKNRKGQYYYPNINKVENLYLEIDPKKDLLKSGDLCFFNGKKTKLASVDGTYIFLFKTNNDIKIYPNNRNDDDIIVKIKCDRLDKIKLIKQIKCQIIDGQKSVA